MDGDESSFASHTYWRQPASVAVPIGALVDANRKLIARFEKKMQAKLAEIWGEPAEVSA